MVKLKSPRHQALVVFDPADLHEVGLGDHQILHAFSTQVVVVAFLRNMPVKLSHNSIFTPARFMMVVC